jgi:predicted DNA-binding transcriptional regulator AlpA
MITILGDDLYLTGPQVNKRFGISSMTRWRWERSARLGFPVPMKINKRSYFKRSELDLWESNQRPNPARAA